MRKVALVTGGNKGIGFAIVKLLCQQYEGDVILTARSEEKGQQALMELRSIGLNPSFHLLDINSTESIVNMKKHLLDTYGGLDVLVNNAGISFRELLEDMEARKPNVTDEEFAKTTKMVAEETVRTNFYSLLNICDILFPILRDGARVVDLSSRGSKRILSAIPKELSARVMKEKNSVEDVILLMQDFIDACATMTYEQKGWPNNAYGVSKLGVTLTTRIKQANIDPDGKRDIAVNSCCPGLVKTYMSGYRGVTPEQGADTPVYLALLPPKTEIRGMFLGDRKPVDLYSFNANTMEQHKVMAGLEK